MNNKSEWYRKLLGKLNQIKSGQLSIDDYIKEVASRIESEKVPCDYRKPDCSNSGYMVNNEWVCSNHFKD